MATEQNTDKAKKEQPKVQDIDKLARLHGTGIEMSVDEKKAYLKMPDDLGLLVAGMQIPKGYKKCGKCQHVMKFYLFNRNSGSKTNTTGNCKECQKASANKSYKKTKKKRNYKKYYDEHKEMKQEQSRKYYDEHKDELNAKHKDYLSTKKGKKVMHKAHAKRAASIAKHQGIPYTRTMVLERDKQGGEYPICYLCGKPILDTSGSACHLDHVVSINNGGLDCFTNIAAVHSTCNLTKEKDDRNLSVEQVEKIKKLAQDYIDKHPEQFEEPSASSNSSVK